MSKTRAGEVWKEIKPFAIRDLLHGGGKAGGGSDDYSILLYHSAGKKLKKYSVTASGLSAALSAATTGDTVFLPASSIDGNFTVPAGVALVGLSRKKSILTGQITISNGSSLENLTIDRDEDSAGAIYGVVDVGGTAHIKNCTIDVSNATGAAYAVYLTTATMYVWDSDLLALTGTDGYACYLSAGSFYQIGGRAKGTVSLMPYNY